MTLDDPLTRDPRSRRPSGSIDPQTGTDPGSPLTIFARILPSVHNVRWGRSPRASGA
ncbi:hypothetical protein QJS66_03625 [Kocuria rhizophila]|nr:hypothetical protein QJS66_03625 [Kocuria rhizophila]